MTHTRSHKKTEEKSRTRNRTCFFVLLQLTPYITGEILGKSTTQRFHFVPWLQGRPAGHKTFAIFLRYEACY